jgi:hypothetical protein
MLLIFLDTFWKVSLSALLICLFIAGPVNWTCDKIEERYGLGASLSATFFLTAVPIYTIFITVIRLYRSK